MNCVVDGDGQRVITRLIQLDIKRRVGFLRHQAYLDCCTGAVDADNARRNTRLALGRARNIQFVRANICGSCFWLGVRVLRIGHLKVADVSATIFIKPLDMPVRRKILKI